MSSKGCWGQPYADCSNSEQTVDIVQSDPLESRGSEEEEDVGVVDSGCHFSQLDMVASEVFLMSLLRVSWQWVSPHSGGFQRHLCDVVRSYLITWQGQN